MEVSQSQELYLRRSPCIAQINLRVPTIRHQVSGTNFPACKVSNQIPLTLPDNRPFKLNSPQVTNRRFNQRTAARLSCQTPRIPSTIRHYLLSGPLARGRLTGNDLPEVSPTRPTRRPTTRAWWCHRRHQTGLFLCNLGTREVSAQH